MVCGGKARGRVDCEAGVVELPQSNQLAAAAPTLGPPARVGVLGACGEEPRALPLERACVAALHLHESELSEADSPRSRRARRVEQSVASERTVRTGPHRDAAAAR